MKKHCFLFIGCVLGFAGLNAQEGPTYQRLLTAKPVEIGAPDSSSQNTARSTIWRSFANRPTQKVLDPIGLESLKGFLFGREIEAGAFVPSYGKGVVCDKGSSGKGTFTFAIEAVYLRPELDNSRGFKAEIDAPRDINFNYDRSLSARIEAGYYCPTSNLGFRARYWQFSDEAGSLAGSDGNGLIADDAIAILAGGGIEDVDSVSVQHELDLDVFDVEATKELGGNTNASLGVRLASMEQTYTATPEDEGALISQLDFIGLGPTVAVESKFPIGESGFALFGSARASGLFGQRKLDSNNYAEEVNNGSSFVNDDEDEFVFNADLKAGIEWTPACLDCFYTRVGVEYQIWNNIGNLRDISDPALDGNFVGPTPSTVDLYGGDIDFFGFTWASGFSF